MIALFGHLAAAVYIFNTPPEMSSGGGGKVLGTLSIALGGSSSKAPETMDEKPADVEQAPVPERTEHPPKARTPVKPQPRETQTKPKVQPRPKKVPAPPPATQAHPVQSPAQQQPPQSTTPANAAPASIASNATPTLGEGAAAAKPGIGGAVDTSATDYDAYLAMLRARIEANRTYPSSARRSGHEGVASIRLVIGSNGKLIQVSVVKSSGHFTLDRAAKRMVQKAQPFPAPPQSTFDVTVPVVFALR